MIENIKLLTCISTVALSFIMLGHLYRDEIQNSLKTPIIIVPSFILDWWSVSHFLLFALFGWIEPEKHMTFAIFGAIFELIEDYLATDSNTQLVDCSKKSQYHWIYKIMCNGVQDDYWYGKFDDIFVNIIGYTVGSALRTTFNSSLV